MRLKVKRRNGFTLIEAMVSVGLFLVGVLSLVQLNATLVRQTSEAKYRADASFLAQEISGQMWADRVNVNSYGTSSYAPRVAFNQKVQLALPNGGVNIATTPSASKTDAVITVSWQQAGEVSHQVVMTTTVAQ